MTTYTTNDLFPEGGNFKVGDVCQSTNPDSVIPSWIYTGLQWVPNAITATANLGGQNGQQLSFNTLTEETTIAAAVNTDTAIQMPAGAIVLSVNVRVTADIPTATTFTVGDSGSAARFSTAAVSVASGSVDKGTKAGAYYNASAAAVRITPNGTPATATGKVRVTIYYISVTPPTS